MAAARNLLAALLFPAFASAQNLNFARDIAPIV
jgi:hypothetical protein